MTVFEPPLRALRQLDDPAFLKVLAASVVGAVVVFAVLGVGVWYVVHALLRWNDWIAGLIGGLGSALLAHYLFLPVAGAVATLFCEPVAAAVERRFYPGLPKARAASLGAQIWDGLWLGLMVLLLQLAALVMTPLLPGVSVLLGYGVAAWAIGRGLFVAIAMRHMTRRQAVAVYAARRGEVFLQGALAVAASLIPFANLLVPVLTVAAMVHVLNGERDDARSGSGLARSRPV
jgi:uncharacterized protein involved in cysteine biosynthesis